MPSITTRSTNPPEVEVTSPRFEVIKSIEEFVGDQLGTLLKPVEESWQPSDFLPDLSKESWHEGVTELRVRAAALPDDLLVVLIGDMITEEALPSYQTWLNRLRGITDLTGASGTAWARWSRGWTAEENRHGDILNRYLYLTGRVDMQAVERTIHYLLNSGFDPHTENDPYLGFVYTSFQERATKISHRNVATLSMRAGETALKEICGLIAGDEARHERAYKLFMTKIFEADPSNALLSFAEMMKKKITMPAHLMFDGQDCDLYAKFSRVAQRIGVYTVVDYAEIIEDLVQHWQISGLTGLTSAAVNAQDYLCTLSERYKKLASRVLADGSDSFSWIYGRTVA